MTPRAITGLGIASALGIGYENVRTALSMGAPHDAQTAPISSFDASAYERLPIVEVPHFEPKTYLGEKGLRTLDRLTKLLVVAARLSLHQAGLKSDGRWSALSPERVGVCSSNAYGSLEAITELDRVALLEDARYINPAKFPNTVSNSASGYVAIWEDLRALNVSVSNGTCGALDAISCADVLLATGRADAIVTGGGESMSEALFLAFDQLGALDVDRGARLGEGAAFVVLETLEGARSRGAKVLAEVTGYGTSFVGPKDDATLLFASGTALERAIAQALADAKLTATDIDLVVSGIGGIARFDDAERAAIETIVGTTPICAPKKWFGETLGAAGALGMSAALAWLDEVTPTCLVSGKPPSTITHVLVTALGYYGNASAVVMRRA